MTERRTSVEKGREPDPFSEESCSDFKRVRKEYRSRREQMVLADKRVNRAGARLRLDAYEAAHGRVEEALRDLRALGEERLVPRYETMRVQLLHRIERQASAA